VVKSQAAPGQYTSLVARTGVGRDIIEYFCLIHRATRRHRAAGLVDRKGGTMKTFEFTVVIERDEDGRYVAICPALPGCYTEGETEQEARDLIEDAIQLHLEDRLERSEPICEEVGVINVKVAV
jgi:predicted RNase H-like HicB family nuclease